MSSGSPALSKRGLRATTPALTYLPLVIAASADVFDAEENRDGFVVLATAENRLSMASFIQPRLSEALCAVGAIGSNLGAGFSNYYDDMRGSRGLREAVASVLGQFLGGGPEEPIFSWDKVIVSAGCGGCVDLLAWTLCEPGDACILPAPWYPAFANDLGVRAGVVPVSAYLEVDGENHESHETGSGSTTTGMDGWHLTEACLENAWLRATAQGNRPRMLLLTNPHNPLGIVLPREELEIALAWARRKDMHIVSDEIYAKSVHSLPAGEEFVSMARIAADPTTKLLPPDVHIVWGISKDFCLSGLRTGFVYTENANVHQALSNLNCFSAVSVASQAVVSDMLSDQTFLDTYLPANNALLARSCTFAMEYLAAKQIPFVRPTSGIFLVINLRKYLAEDTWEAERAIFTLLGKHKVILTPGRDCCFQKPGFFRVCFAAVQLDALKVGLDRITSILQRS